MHSEWLRERKAIERIFIFDFARAWLKRAIGAESATERVWSPGFSRSRPHEGAQPAMVRPAYPGY